MSTHTKTKITLDTKDEMSENLSRYNPHFLKVHEFAEQTYRLYRKWKLERISLTIEQKNLIDWYEKSMKAFSYPKRADGKNIYLSLDKLQRIREIETQPNHFLKLVLEMILNYVLLEELKKQVPNWNICVYWTTSYDDIFWWIDAVVWYDTEFAGRKMRCHLWIDYCVTNSQRYIEEKGRKRKMSNPEEFNFMMWWRNDSPIPRIIKAFNPYIISHLYTYAVLAITQWKKVDFWKLYNSIKNSSDNPLIKQALATSGIVDEILNNT